jgi:hypothetical protein
MYFLGELFFNMESYHIAQTGLKLLGSTDLPEMIDTILGFSL